MPLTHVAFTGTQRGLTPHQREQLRKFLRTVRIMENGMCIGADAEAAKMVRDMWDHEVTVNGHPSTIWGKRAPIDALINGQMHPPRTPLYRNRIMVDLADGVLACPAEMSEQLRSGTWATVRYARKMGKPVTIIWPEEE